MKSQLRVQIEELKRKIKAESARLLEEMGNAADDCYKYEQNKLAELPQAEQEQLKLRSAYMKKRNRTGKFGLIFFLAYAALYAVLLFAILDNVHIGVYIGAAVFGIAGALALPQVLKIPYTQKIAAIEENKTVSEYLKDIGKYSDARHDSIDESALNEYERELDKLENQLFNLEYENCILFYGAHKTSAYKIYIDGNLYQENRGNNLVKIMLNPGIHTFRIEEAWINIVDQSIDKKFNYEAVQVVFNENTKVACFICKNQFLQKATREELESVAKVSFV
jgi:hypothetical protein